MSSVQSIRVDYPHILNLPSCHTDSTTTRAYPHIIESPSVPYLRLPAVIPPSLTSFPRPSAPSFPRPSRHSRVGGNPSNLAPDMRTHADDDATNRAAAQIWKKGGRGCRVVAERRT